MAHTCNQLVSFIKTCKCLRYLKLWAYVMESIKHIILPLLKIYRSIPQPSTLEMGIHRASHDAPITTPRERTNVNTCNKCIWNKKNSIKSKI